MSALEVWDFEALEIKNFKSPDEVRNFSHGKVEVVNIMGGSVGRLTLEPGWRWSLDIKPLVNTEWCEAPHFQYQVSGHLHGVMADGTEFDTYAGEVVSIPPNHDGWVVGNEPVVFIDFTGAANYAKKT